MTTIALGQKKKSKTSEKGVMVFIPLLFIFVGAALFSVYFGMKAFFSSSYFRIKEIRWSGVKQIDEGVLNEKFRFVLGRSLPSLNISDIHSVLISSGWIKEAVVRKVFPDRVDVLITERVPAAVEVDPISNKMVLRDGEGVIIQEVSEGEADGLTRIAYYNPDAYGKALELAPLLSRRPEALINLSRPDDIWVHLKGGVLRFGDRDYQKRWKRFVQVEEDIKRRGITPWEADLRFPSKVVVRKGNEPVEVAAGDQDIEY